MSLDKEKREIVEATLTELEEMGWNVSNTRARPIDEVVTANGGSVGRGIELDLTLTVGDIDKVSEVLDDE